MGTSAAATGFLIIYSKNSNSSIRLNFLRFKATKKSITSEAERVSSADSIASVFETPEAGSIAALSKNTTSVGEL
jgi:hypothetical protein